MEGMQKTTLVRRMDDLGRVIIPKDIRREMGITKEEEEAGVPFQIFYTAEGVFFKRVTEEEVDAIRAEEKAGA